MKKICFIIMVFTLFSFIKSDTTEWVQKAYYGGGQICKTASFTIGNYAYVGTGSSSYSETSSSSRRAFYRYDPSTDVWNRIADLPSPANIRTKATGFSVNGKGYVCGGYYYSLSGSKYLSDIWEYDPATNLWYQRTSFPRAGGITNGTAFSIGSVAYVGLGFSVQSGWMNDFYKYEPTQNKWTKLNDFPGAPRDQAVGFSINGKGYVGMGRAHSGAGPIYFKDFWEYDPATDSWTRLPDFPGEGRYDVIGYGVDDCCYLGLGGINDFYKYDVNKREWTNLNYLPGAVRNGPFSFCVASKIYYGGGSMNSSAVSDLWEYATISLSPSLSVSPLSVNIAANANSTKTFDITSNISWTATSDQNWLSLSETSGSNNATITLTAQDNTGTANRVATVTIAGTGVSNQTITVNQEGRTTGVDNPSVSKIKIYPNPASNVLFIDGYEKNAQLTIVDIKGKLMIDTQVKENHVDISELATGIYIVKILNKKELTIKKFIKK